MADKEKKIPDAEVESAVEEKKVKKEGKPFPTMLVSILAGGVIVLAAVVFVALGLIFGSSAATAYNANKYEDAYNASKMAFFMDDETRCFIVEAYVENVLCKNGNYVEAAEIIENTKWVSSFEKDGAEITPEARVAKLYAKDGKLAMFKVGSVTEFGEYSGEKVAWVVTAVKEEEIGGATHKVAYLISRDIVTSSMGWGAQTKWDDSNLKSASETFFNLFNSNLSEADRKSVLTTKFAVPEGEAEAKIWVPSVAEIEAMMADEALKSFVVAEPTANAKKLTVKPAAGEKGANYYLRDLGKKEQSVQYVYGVNGKGELKDGMSMDTTNIGLRVCMRVDLGAK